MPIIVIKCKTIGERVLHARKTILSSEGRVFQCGFVKRTTGEERFGNFRLGVSKYVTGEGMKYDPKQHDLMTVFEFNNKEGMKEKEAYRCLNLRGIFHLKVDGIEYHYNPKP